MRSYLAPLAETIIFINLFKLNLYLPFCLKLGLKTVISPLRVDIFSGKEVGLSFFTILILSLLIFFHKI